MSITETVANSPTSQETNTWRDVKVVAKLFEVASEILLEASDDNKRLKQVLARRSKERKSATARHMAATGFEWPNSNNKERAVNGHQYGVRLVNYAFLDALTIFNHSRRALTRTSLGLPKYKRPDKEQCAEILTSKSQATHLLIPARFKDMDNQGITGIAELGRRNIRITDPATSEGLSLLWRQDIIDHYERRQEQQKSSRISPSEIGCPAVQTRVIGPSGSAESAIYGFWNMYVHAQLGLAIPEYRSPQSEIVTPVPAVCPFSASK